MKGGQAIVEAHLVFTSGVLDHCRGACNTNSAVFGLSDGLPTLTLRKLNVEQGFPNEFPIASKKQEEPNWIVERLRPRDHAGWSTDRHASRCLRRGRFHGNWQSPRRSEE